MSSYDIYVDNCASRSITNDLNDLVDKPTQADVHIYGTNGVSTGTLMGTVEWEIEDDYGSIHKIRIPNTIYSAANRNRLLSPQHWAQGANDRYPIRYGTWCATYDDRIVLYWEQRKYKRTVYLLEEGSNIGMIRGVQNAKGDQEYDRLFKAFKNEVIAIPTVLETICHDTEEYAELKTEKNHGTHQGQSQDPIKYPSGIPSKESDKIDMDDYLKTNYELNTMEINEDLELSQERAGTTGGKDPKQDYLYWHHKLGHLSHGRMLQLVKNGTLPRHLRMTTAPICVACMNGKATRKPWRTKAKPNASGRTTSHPGECVAIDQLDSSTAGFIGQMRGSILTTQRYRYATVFVDQFSATEETLKAKKAFEIHADSFGVKVRQYHADNGRFQDIKFKEDYMEQAQRITYCGVNAYFQKAELKGK
jgi:hypothetical protein